MRCVNADWLIVGAGFTGCTLAERIATQLNRKVVLVDRRPRVGGNAYDEYDDNGVLVHRFGPHIFHTNSTKVFDYLSTFTEWRAYEHRVQVAIGGRKVPAPFNLNSLHSLFPAPEAAEMEGLLAGTYGEGAKVPILKMREHPHPRVRKLAEFIYENVFYGYTLKQWRLAPEDLDPSVTGRVPVHISRDDRYFQDRFQTMPAAGYSALFQRMLRHPNIEIVLNCDHRAAHGIRFRRMIYTGPIDEFFDYVHGELPYRSIRFDFLTAQEEWHQGCGTVNYPNDYEYTRITEQKYLSGQSLPKSTLVVEYPEAHVRGRNEPYYPVPREENRNRYERYLRELRALNGSVVMAGRLADYKYYNMDQAVARAMKVFEEEVAG